MAIVQVATATTSPFSVASSGTQRVLLVWLQTEPNVAVTSVSFAGAPLQRIGAQQRVEGRAELWAMTGAPQGVYDVVINAPGINRFNAMAVSMNQMDTQAPFGAVTGQSGIGNPFSNEVGMTPVVVAEDDFVMAGLFRWGFSTGDVISAAGQERLWQVGVSGFDTVGDWKPTGQGGFLWDLGVAGSTPYAALAVALRGAPAPIGGIHDFDMGFRAILSSGAPILPGLTSWRLRYLPNADIAFNLQLSNNQPDAVDTGVITSAPPSLGYDSSVVGFSSPLNGGEILSKPVQYKMPAVNGTAFSVIWKGMGFEPCSPGVPVGTCTPVFYEWITVQFLADASATSPVFEPLPPVSPQPPVDTWPPAGGGGGGGGGGTGQFPWIIAGVGAALLLLLLASGQQNCDFECYKIIDPILRAECETRQRKCLEDKARKEAEDRERRAGLR